MTTDFSILFISYDSAGEIQEAIQSLEQNGELVNEIIVVNNKPKDKNLDRLSSQYSQVKVVHNLSNRGFSYAVNKGMEHASNDLVLICNPDIIFQNNILASLKLLMEANDEIGVVGPKILDPNLGVQASARSFPSWKTLFFNRYSLLGRLLPRSRPLRKYLYPANKDEPLVEVDWVSASCMLVRREAFLEAGKFDVGYFLFMEDVDFCWRVKKNTRYKVLYYRDVSVIHKIGISSRSDNKELIRHRHASIRRFIDKFYADKPAILRFLGKIAIRTREYALLVMSNFRQPSKG